MSFFKLLDDGDILGALFQTTAALLAVGCVVLAGNEPSVGDLGPGLEVVNAKFVHDAKDLRYGHALLTGQ